MEIERLTSAGLKAVGIGAFFRPRDLEPLEISFAELQRLVIAGKVEKVGAGLYRVAAAEPSEFEAFAMVASAVPGGIICLLSTLRKRKATVDEIRRAAEVCHARAVIKTFLEAAAP